jgi:hypothetical protein
LQKFQTCQCSADYHEGWRYFSEKTKIKAGTDPSNATHARQAELEERELKAMRSLDTSGLSTSGT